jgi:histidinol dehydrogenase
VRLNRSEWDGGDVVGAARGLRAAQPRPEEVASAVFEIIDQVARRRDEALRDLSRRLDGVERDRDSLRVDAAEIERAVEATGAEVREAMELAASNVRAVAEAEGTANSPLEVKAADGRRIQLVDSPIGAAGIYAPGGRAGYPSSVLMGCIPARVAGVERIAVASPPRPDGNVHPAVLAACDVAGVEEVYAIGGAQAITALALGTETVAPVDLVAGPGNRFVVEAKRLLSGLVGIDGIAGPTELVVVADGSADPDWVALDVCAQAEHGTEGLLVTISPDAGLIDRLAELLPELVSERPSVPDATVELLLAPGVDEALELADALAPEHLELQLEGVDEQAARERVAGCVFVGPFAGAAFGDYAAGANHVLPTGEAARFGSPLGVRTFLRRSSIVTLPRAAANALAPAVGALSRAEGFPVHAESAEARAGKNGGGA